MDFRAGQSDGLEMDHRLSICMVYAYVARGRGHHCPEGVCSGKRLVKCGSSHVCGFSHVLLEVSRSLSFTFIDNAILQSAVVEINRPVCDPSRIFLCLWPLQFLSGSWKHFL